MRGVQSIPLGISEGRVTGNSFTFSVAAGNDAATFAGERSGDRITLRNLTPDPSGTPIVLNRVDSFPASRLDPPAAAVPASTPAGWRGYNRSAALVREPGRSIIRVDARPGQYENAISPVPDPDGWFRARIVLDGRSVSVFVDDATVPTLTVDALTKPRGGMVGLWLVNGSSGDFANLRLLPKDP